MLRKGLIYSIMMLICVCFWFPFSALAAESQERCMEKAEIEFQNCLKKAKNDQDKAACEKQFAIDYEKCDAVLEE
jgi:hypothetical protein